MRRESKFNSINVVPFVDIMLVLLVIVLLVASFTKTNTIKAKLPSSTASSKSKKENIKIEIRKNGEIFFNKEQIKKEDIANRLNKFKNKEAVLIYADKDLKYMQFVDIVDILQQNNFTNIGIVTQK